MHVRRQTAPGKPLLLLHGLGSAGVVWQSFARRLNPPWQAIAPDLRGHGESDHPIVGYEAPAYAEDVAALLRAINVSAVPVIGHSLGALVALALAAAHQQHVQALVLLDPPLDPNLENPEIADVYRLRKAPEGELEAYLSAPILAPVFRSAADAAFEAILNSPRSAQWAWVLAGSVKAPTLIVRGDPAQGGVLGPAAAKDFVSRLPRGELLELPGASHVVHVSHPQQVADAVLRFLERTAPS
jgi:pimeloyl-ACP methyl ester carboxylesterase